MDQAPSPLSLAIAAAGSLTKLAAQLGMHKSSVAAWRKRIPAERVHEVSAVTGLTPEQLRPDLFKRAG
jgi:DNA-binding transcriptional regulator YdaS (Cro superfamily)